VSTTPLRLLVFDRTCRGRARGPGLSQVWGAGRQLYRALGRLDGGFGAQSWQEALDWLIAVAPGRPIAEIQFWGHGRWGEARIADEGLDASALRSGHRHHERLARLRERLLPGADGLWWFRACEMFGTPTGQDFARAWTRFFGCRAAGHTYVIGAWQSGLHSLLPGAEPTWSAQEGLPPGETAPRVALSSHRRAPHTITFLHGAIPSGY
jgi:hypothetical protein